MKNNIYLPVVDDSEEYAKAKFVKRGLEFIYLNKVSQLIDILIKKGVITLEDLDGYKKLKEIKNQAEEELDKKYGRKERTI